MKRTQTQLNVNVTRTIKASALLMAERDGVSLSEYMAMLVERDLYIRRPIAKRIG